MRPKIVVKTWGMETWYVNRDYCGKSLIFAEDHRCSMHFHKVKHETFLITEGRILLEMIVKEGIYWRILSVGDTAEIPIGVPHRMTAWGGNASMTEFSSHHEDSDSYRIESGQVWGEGVHNVI